MKTVALIIGAVIGVFCGALSLYQVWACLGIFRKKRSIPEAENTTRFAVIIPARNERNVVGALISSLKKQDYPAELFDIYAVPNNCSDDTEQVAEAAGARILKLTSPVHSKGEVLHQAFGQLLAMGKYDAFCIFDADNLVDPGFLHQANDAFRAGYKCAQGWRRSKNPTDSWVSGSMTVFYQFMAMIFNESRWRRGLSAHLNGTGIMVGAELLEGMDGWNTKTLTEDLEFTGLCALNGSPIAWMDDAIVYDEQPTKFWTSCVQRRRWTAGSLQCTRRLTINLLKKKTGPAFDAGMLFACNIMNYIGVLSALLTLFDPRMQALLTSFSFGMLGRMALTYVLLPWLGFALAAYVMLRFAGVKEHMAPTLVMFPVFMFSWTFVNLWAAFTKPPVWKAIAHGTETVPDGFRKK